MKQQRHGLWNTPEYQVWQMMIQRCFNPRCQTYKHYGARGISVCERWRYSVVAFLDDMGRRPPKHELDRIDNDGNYEPVNCRWVTRTAQIRNRRLTKLLTWNGQTLPVAEWAERQGMRPYILSARLNLGWSIERALYHPVTYAGPRT